MRLEMWGSFLVGNDSSETLFLIQCPVFGTGGRHHEASFLVLREPHASLPYYRGFVISGALYIV